MAVGSGVPYNQYTGNGVTTVFAYGFTLLASADLVVTINGVVTSAYTVSGIGVAAGGSITFSSAPASGATVLLQRVIQLVRDAEYQNNGDLQAETVNADFDRLWTAVQQSAQVNVRSVRAPLVEALSDLPAAATRSGKMLAFSASTGDVDLTAFTTTQVANAVAAAYAAGAVLPFVNAAAHGALGDSSTDDTDSIQTAIDIAGPGIVWLPRGGYVTTDSLTMTTAGGTLLGAGRNGTSLLPSFRGGPVIRISESRCCVANLAVSSLAGSARRLASPFGKTAPDASVDGNSLDYGILFQEGANPLTFSQLSSLEITNQPADGIVWYGEGACTVYDRVNVTVCGGHGMYFDEGGRAGLSLGRPGIVDIKNCLVQLCWGHGIALATEGSNTCYRFNLVNCEIYNNCHGDGGVNQPAFYSSLEAAVAGRCQNLVVELGAVGVCNVGILLGTTTVADIRGTRFITCADWGTYINPGCSRITISKPYYDPDPAVGIRVRESCDNITVDGLLDGDLATPIDAESEVRVIMNNKLHFTVPGSNALWQAEGIAAATIASGTCDIRARTVRIIGEGDVLDTVGQFRFASGIAVPDGYRFTICNFNAYNITIADVSGGGSNNIQVQGSNAVLEPGESLEFVAYSGVYYAIGREIP